MSHNHPPHIPHPPYPPIPDPDNPNAPYVDVGQFKPFRAWSSRVIHDHGLERKAYKGQVLPDIMTFGSIALGSVSASQSVVVTNVGFRPLPIVDVVGVGDFIVTTNCPIGGNLPPGEACIVSVTFAPQRLGNQSGGVYVNTGNAAGTEFVQLLGSGIDGGGPGPNPGDGIIISISNATIESVGTGEANLSLFPLSLAFGNVELGSDSSTLSLTLSNTGGEAAQITELDVTGDFSFVTPSAGVGTTIPAGGSVTIRVRFTPTVLGPRTGEVSLNTSVQTDGSFTVSLSGTGAEDVPEPVEPLQRLRIVGNQFVRVDSGLPVRLKSVNWFGAEGGNFTPHGTWVRPWKDILDHIKAMGFNCIRVPFSGDLTASGLIPPQSAFGNSGANDDLLGLTALEILDKYFDYCAELGLYVVLDHHRRTAGNGADGTPIAGAYTMASWKASWAVMCNRYKNHIAVVGADLHNEPHDLSWSTWASYAEEAGNHVLSLAPLWLIFVEGVGTNNDTTQYWWGGALKDVRTRPVVLSVPNKVAYSPHEYGQSVGHQQWLAYEGQTVPANWPLNLSAVWDANWGYIFYEAIAPIWIGEMGGHFGYDPETGALGRPHATQEREWMSRLVRYLNFDRTLDGTLHCSESPPGTTTQHRGMSFAYWSFNPNSGDTGGLVQGDWVTPQQGKLDLIGNVLTETYTVPLPCVAPPPPPPPPTVATINSFTATPTNVASGGAVTLAWNVTVSGSYAITITGQSGNLNKTGSVVVNPTVTSTYTLIAANEHGTVSATASVTVAGTPEPPIDPYVPPLPYALNMQRNDLDFLYSQEIAHNQNPNDNIVLDILITNLSQFFLNGGGHIPFAIIPEITQPHAFHCGPVIRNGKLLFSHGLGFFINWDNKVVAERWNGTTSPDVYEVGTIPNVNTLNKIGIQVQFHGNQHPVSPNVVDILITNGESFGAFNYLVGRAPWGFTRSPRYRGAIGGIGSFVPPIDTGCVETTSSGPAAAATFTVHNLSVFVNPN